MQQRVSNPKLNWWQGLLLIVGIVVMLMVFQFAAAAVALMIGGPNAYPFASFAFWIFGGVIALYLLRRFIMQYQYTLEGINFRIDRVYGGMKPRMALTVITRSIAALGTPEEIEGKYPGSHPSVYVRRGAGLEVMALAYQSDGRVKVIHFQPNEELAEKLRACVGK